MFSKCKNPMDVLAVLNNMADKYALVGVNARGAEFLTFLDRPIVHKLPKGYDKLIIYKEMEVLK